MLQVREVCELLKTKQSCEIIYNSKSTAKHQQGLQPFCARVTHLNLCVSIQVFTEKCVIMIIISFISTCCQIKKKMSLKNKPLLITWVSPAEHLSNHFNWLKLISNISLVFVFGLGCCFFFFFKQWGKRNLDPASSSIILCLY